MTTNISFIHDPKLVNGTTSIAGESQELVDALQKIVQHVGTLLEVHYCSLALLDASGTKLVSLAAMQADGEKQCHTGLHLNDGVASWVAEHHEALIINDVSQDSRCQQAGSMPNGSLVYVPLMEHGTFIGILTVSNQQTNAFDTKHVDALSILAEQAVLVITSIRIAERAQRRANQLEMLIDLSRSITTRLEPAALHNAILSDVRRLVTCNQVQIYRYNEQAQELSTVAQWSGEERRGAEAWSSSTNIVEHISLYDKRSIVAWAALHHHPMLLSPLQAQDEASRSSDLPLMAELAVPFVSRSKVYGVLLLKRVQPFTHEELRLARNLSSIVAAALENVELFQQVHSDHEQLRAILESSSDGMALLDADGRILEVNPAFGHLFGVEPDTLVGQECITLFDQSGEEDAQRDLKRVCKALQQEHALPYTEIDLSLQGTPRSIGLSITLVTATSQPLCLLVVRDVTAIRDVNRMRANFLSMVTHELRSPLNGINGYLDLALSGVGGELNESLREFLQRARASSEYLYALLEDLFLIARADAGQLRLNRTIVSLQEIIANAVEEQEVSAIDHGIHITVDIANDMPRLYADAGRLQQVLRNLLSNALRFTPEGGQVTISAQVETQEQQESSDADPEDFGDLDKRRRVVKLQVSDTGIGIGPEYQGRIFERFYQVPNNSAGRSGGQGLGLAIVKMIVELHGGNVTVESVPGQSSTFICVLPCLLS